MANDIFNDFRNKQSEEKDALHKTPYEYTKYAKAKKWRELNEALDEAERRRIEGGWDTWQ